MKKLIWFCFGIGVGILAAKQLEENPRAQELVDDATRKAREFGAAVSEGFREREAELQTQGKPAKSATVSRTAKTKTVSKQAVKSANQPAAK